ncbi:BlaI/MecI/CopY family transcriptional regulator [Candidatus Woesearchaeota archaeon]|nr:BlaI/MecI/CopY family transcriptional regulator [Candidatus Woesearchaeota archaeon]
MKRLNVKNFNSILSPLEEDLLQLLWPDKSMKVKELYDILKKQKKKAALSSVAVILDRLYQKKVVDRKIETAPGGVRYIYYPKKNQKQFEASVVENAVNTLINKFGSTAVNYFNERFSKRR